MGDAEHIYISSPWFVPLVLCIGISFGFLVIAWIRGRRLLRMKELCVFLLLFLVLNLAAAGAAWFIAPMLPTGQPRLVIHRDYLACSSWKRDGELMRVPWHSFSQISRQRSSRRFRFLEIDLQLELDPGHAREVPWGDWIRSRVNCSISWLTDDPRRFGFADTAEIQAQVEAAWRAAVGRNSRAARPSYNELTSGGPASSRP